MAVCPSDFMQTPNMPHGRPIFERTAKISPKGLQNALYRGKMIKQ
jgi:hypothetical protein